MNVAGRSTGGLCCRRCNKVGFDVARVLFVFDRDGKDSTDGSARERRQLKGRLLSWYLIDKILEHGALAKCSDDVGEVVDCVF